jgi:hypothetical protein
MTETLDSGSIQDIREMGEDAIHSVIESTRRNSWRAIATTTMLAGGVGLSQAQVTLTIPTDDIFTSINNWIATFAPIVAIGIGIAAAIAILSFVGKQIVSAFKG